MNTISKRYIKRILQPMQEHLDETNQKIAEFPHIKDKIKLSRQMSIYSIKFYTYLYNGDKINARKYLDKYKQGGQTMMDLLMEADGNCVCSVIDITRKEKTDIDYFGDCDDENARQIGNTLMEEFKSFDQDILCILIP